MKTGVAILISMRIVQMCINLQNSTWGASYIALKRILKPIYENRFNTPVGMDKTMKYYGCHKPLIRLVSTTLISTKQITANELKLL